MKRPNPVLVAAIVILYIIFLVLAFFVSPHYKAWSLIADLMCFPMVILHFVAAIAVGLWAYCDAEASHFNGAVALFLFIVTGPFIGFPIYFLLKARKTAFRAAFQGGTPYATHQPTGPVQYSIPPGYKLCAYCRTVVLLQETRCPTCGSPV